MNDVRRTGPRHADIRGKEGGLPVVDASYFVQATRSERQNRVPGLLEGVVMNGEEVGRREANEETLDAKKREQTEGTAKKRRKNANKKIETVEVSPPTTSPSRHASARETTGDKKILRCR